MRISKSSVLFATTLLGAFSACAQSAITRPEVSEAAIPFETVEVAMPEGHKALFVMRTPLGDGPFPAMLYLHGTLEPREANKLVNSLRQQTLSRFLAAGYVTAAATFRSRSQDPLTRDALEDCLAIVAHLKQHPKVDARSIVVWGDSGGGSLALELAGETDLAAVIGCEPATVLFTGMFSTDNLEGGPPYSSMSGLAIMEDPVSYYTPRLKAYTREKIARIRCPILIAHGDRHVINKINNEIVVPELKAANKTPEVILYPGGGHSLSHAGKPDITLKFFNDAHAFCKRHLETQPVPIAESLVTESPVEEQMRDPQRGQDEAPDGDDSQFDRTRARELFQKYQSGEKLSPAEEEEFRLIREEYAKQRANREQR